MNSSPVIVSFSIRNDAALCIISLLADIMLFAFSCAFFIMPRTSLSISAAVSFEHTNELSFPRYALFTVSSSSNRNCR